MTFLLSRLYTVRGVKIFTIQYIEELLQCIRYTNHKARRAGSRRRRRRATRTSSRHFARRRVRPRRGSSADAPRAGVPHADDPDRRADPSPMRFRSRDRRARDAPRMSPLRAARTPSSPFGKDREKR